jgi:hypothetical protein
MSVLRRQEQDALTKVLRQKGIDNADIFCDLVDAWSRRTGVKAAARISAAGLGGNIAVFCEKDKIEELTKFLQKHYYDGYLKELFEKANTEYHAALNYQFGEKTKKEFNPGEGVVVVTGDLTPVKDMSLDNIPSPQVGEIEDIAEACLLNI